jgi:photosystem II stability/assembly factor-like uncharacterized protein
MRAPALVVCLAAVLAVPSSAAAAVTTGGSGWLWANPVPQGNSLDELAFVGARGAAVGAEGTIVRTDDGGATWSAASSGTETGLTEVAMPDANTVYAGGGCVLRRSTDGGATFQRVAFAAKESKCDSPLLQIAFPTPSVGYVFLRNGTVLRTTNAGRSFTRRASLQIVPQGAVDAVFTSETTGVISTGLTFPRFLRTEDGGQSWSQISAGPQNSRVRSISFVTPLVGFAVGDGAVAGMSKTEDGGKTWAQVPLTGATGLPEVVHCADANTCVIVSRAEIGDSKRLTWTADGGQTATTVPVDVNLSDVAFSSPTRVVAVGAGGATLASDDAGHTFARVGGVVPGAFEDLRTVGDRSVFAFPTGGALAGSTDAGLSWHALGAPPLARVVDVSFATDAFGYMLTGGGALQRTDDGGASWGVLGTEATGGRAVLATGPDSLLVGSGRGVSRSTDAGVTFAAAAGATRPVGAFDRAGSALIAFGARTLLVSTNGGARWRELRRPPGGLIQSADFVSGKLGYVVRDDGDVLSTSNGGRSWKPLNGVGRDDIARVSFGDAKHGFLLLATDSGLGGVLRTSDAGRTWRPQVLGTQPLISVVALGSAGGVVLADQTGELYATSTGGDAGARSALSLRVASKRRAGRGTRVTVAGRLKPATAGAGVSVTARIRGSWVRKFATVSAGGRFVTTWSLRAGTVFVAQWRGAPGVQGDGTAPLSVRVGGKRHR